MSVIHLGRGGGLSSISCGLSFRLGDLAISRMICLRVPMRKYLRENLPVLAELLPKRCTWRLWFRQVIGLWLQPNARFTCHRHRRAPSFVIVISAANAFLRSPLEHVDPAGQRHGLSSGNLCHGRAGTPGLVALGGLPRVQKGNDETFRASIE